jgi:glyoxylase-like metal-dependent hydrolase (beta-lactamase superfamily II)
MPLRIGRFTLHEIRDAIYFADGGAMFGPVPWREWAPAYPPDPENTIELMSRCLLVDDGARKILVDTGLGDRMPLSEQIAWKVDRTGFDLDRELARAGTSRDGITDVVVTHLHREHSGGITRRRPDGVLELGFPNATLHLQRRQFRWAHHPSERDAASFRVDDFTLLEQSGKLHLCEGETELFEGVQICVSEGHTVGQQLFILQADEGQVLSAGDLIPTAGHLKLAWQMAADLYPLTSLEEKKMLLAQAVEAGTIVFFPHEMKFAACRLSEVDGGVVAGDTVEF